MALPFKSLSATSLLILLILLTSCGNSEVSLGDDGTISSPKQKGIVHSDALKPKANPYNAAEISIDTSVLFDYQYEHGGNTREKSFFFYSPSGYVWLTATNETPNSFNRFRILNEVQIDTSMRNEKIRLLVEYDPQSVFTFHDYLDHLEAFIYTDDYGQIESFTIAGRTYSTKPVVRKKVAANEDPPIAPAASTMEYTVTRHDKGAGAIAHRFGMTLRELKAKNPSLRGSNPVIRPGQKLIVNSN